MKSSITLYTKDDCSACDKSKKWLAEANIKFQEIKIGADIDRETIRKMFPDQKTVPIVVVTQIGGSELAFLAAQDEIENNKHHRKENEYVEATH